MKLWAGRTAGDVDKRLNDFNSSLPFDCRLFEQDIEGSLAHAKMLCDCGIITTVDYSAILKGLDSILNDIKTGELTFESDAEDIHMFIEAELTQRIGDAGKRLHTARSRNDQVAVDLRLYLRGRMSLMSSMLCNLVDVLVKIGEQHTGTVMSGYTHLQRAQPITFAHHLSAYCYMFLRDLSRLHDCNKRMNECPLGSGALASTGYDIDRYQTAQLLGFDRPCGNSLDGVSDRDYCIELAGALSIIMVHLSRFCEEIILWCSHEFKYIELDDRFSTGSSIMPQKKNPDIAELVRGKSGRVVGDLVALITMLKGTPLAYNKDMQEDKEAIFDAVDTVVSCLEAFTPMVETMKVIPQNMRAAAAKGFINATDCADYLVGKGMAFRDAYRVVGALVSRCIKEDKTLETLSITEYNEASELFAEDIYETIVLERCVEVRKATGGPSAEAVKKSLEDIKQRLTECKNG